MTRPHIINLSNIQSHHLYTSGSECKETIYIAADLAFIIYHNVKVVAILKIISVLLHLLLRHHEDLHPRP